MAWSPGPRIGGRDANSARGGRQIPRVPSGGDETIEIGLTVDAARRWRVNGVECAAGFVTRYPNVWHIERSDP